MGSPASSEPEDLRHIAHDLNNVLGTILNYAEVIERRLGNDQALVRAVKQTKAAAQRGALLTEKLTEDWTPPLSPAGDLVGVVHNLAPIIRKQATESISIEFRIEPGPISVPVDPHDLAQVVLNLTTNSLESLARLDGDADRSLEVEVRRVLRPLPKGQSTLSALLAVTDNGHGMSSEVASRAFEPFFTTRNGFDSWGLGLTLADRVVNRCGGLIELHSQDKKGASERHGTRVEVYFPTTGAPSADSDTQAASSNAANKGKGEMVLVVDDDHDVRYLVGRILKENGYRVVDAATPHEAVGLANETKEIDAVLTDVVMPSMLGTELADILQRRFGSALKVLFLSGFSGGRELQSGYRVLPKPFTEKELLRRLRRILDEEG